MKPHLRTPSDHFVVIIFFFITICMLGQFTLLNNNNNNKKDLVLPSKNEGQNVTAGRNTTINSTEAVASVAKYSTGWCHRSSFN